MKGRKKQRVKMLKEKRDQREKNNWKKHQYQEMRDKGILGNKELQKYSMMYEFLKEYRKNFPTPDENPTRRNYNDIKIIYNSIDSKF